MEQFLAWHWVKWVSWYCWKILELQYVNRTCHSHSCSHSRWSRTLIHSCSPNAFLSDMWPYIHLSKLSVQEHWEMGQGPHTKEVQHDQLSHLWIHLGQEIQHLTEVVGGGWSYWPQDIAILRLQPLLSPWLAIMGACSVRRWLLSLSGQPWLLLICLLLTLSPEKSFNFCEKEFEGYSKN